MRILKGKNFVTNYLFLIYFYFQIIKLFRSLCYLTFRELYSPPVVRSANANFNLVRVFHFHCVNLAFFEAGRRF